MDTRSKTKKMLHEQLNRAIKLQEDGASDFETLETLKEIIEGTNKNTIEIDIKRRADNIDEVLLDAKIISSTTNFCLNAVDAFDINMDAYNFEDFASHLTRYLKDDDEEVPNWEKLEDEAVDCFKITPSFSYIYGCFKESKITPSQAERARRERSGRFEACARSQPDNIVSVNKEETGVDETVKIMLSILREYCKTNQTTVSYFHFIIDDDFSQTIENIFHFAFLIRDGAVKIYIEENDNLPYIKCTSKSREPSEENEKVENTQQVISIDWDDWMDLRQCLNIEKGIYSQIKESRRPKIYD